jgi:V/A-type H+-transporting ATPase subunit B
MGDGVGKGLTRADHLPLMAQLYAAYAHAEEIRMMTRILGEEDLSETDRCYLRFGLSLEAHFISQGKGDERTIEESLDIGWRCLGTLPPEELTRLTKEQITDHLALLQMPLDKLQDGGRS